MRTQKFQVLSWLIHKSQHQGRLFPCYLTASPPLMLFWLFSFFCHSKTLRVPILNCSPGSKPSSETIAPSRGRWDSFPFVSADLTGGSWSSVPEQGRASSPSACYFACSRELKMGNSAALQSRVCRVCAVGKQCLYDAFLGVLP